ncbi:hypothetical protein V6N12_010046 [Hibiscus sabdariffa]|uniref:Uncharacterized protein n=1 Tax=Hibiscus sabdariffa TaxID=183260 RepID=A0ABR2ECJ5_9ROSI
MTTGRINQVAFLRDVRPVCSSTHYLGRGEAITGRDHRSCRGTKCTSYERPGPRPYAHEIFRIQKHDRASMHRRGRIMPIDTLGTPSTTEVHRAATRISARNDHPRQIDEIADRSCTEATLKKRPRTHPGRK